MISFTYRRFVIIFFIFIPPDMRYEDDEYEMEI